MTNPFDDENGEFLLVNVEKQHSLRPSQINVPAGRRQVGPSGARKTCLDWIDEHWTDMRPKSLVEAMNGSNDAGTA